MPGNYAKCVGFFPRGALHQSLLPPCQVLGDIHSSLSAQSVLCPQGSVCARTAQKSSGSSFLTLNLQDEKWATMGKIHWHENSHRGLGSNSVSGGKSRGKHMVTLQPFASRFLSLQINPY